MQPSRAGRLLRLTQVRYTQCKDSRAQDAVQGSGHRALMFFEDASSSCSVFGSFRTWIVNIRVVARAAALGNEASER